MEEKTESSILLAVRLGWLTVEVFGRLRHYALSKPGPDEQPGDASRRFDFSSRTMSEYDALLLAMDQLDHTATRLDPSLPSVPIPAHEDLDHIDLDTLQGGLDDWSTQVWIALSAEDDITGRAFSYGGGLADTYWHASVMGPRGFGELLRPNRLEYLVHRFDGIAHHMPIYTARVLNYTLYKWRGAYEYLKTLDLAGKNQVLKRLESQAGVWHYLLFGEHGAQSYLTVEDRRFVTWVAGGITAVSALAIVVLVWLAVMALSSAGRGGAAALIGSPEEMSAAQAAIVGDLVDWQKWSTVLATISSLVVLIAGLVTRLSGWAVTLHNFVKDRLALRRIYRRAYRDWRA
jgi:hypothetical protein